MLLSNLTATSTACSILLSMTIPIIPSPNVHNGFYPTQSRCGSSPPPVPYPAGDSREVRALPLLIDAFVEGAQVVEDGDLDKRTRKGELHFLASVFANMTMVCAFIVSFQQMLTISINRVQPVVISFSHRCPYLS
jgi:hypothetical protein